KPHLAGSRGSESDPMASLQAQGEAVHRSRNLERELSGVGHRQKAVRVGVAGDEEGVAIGHHDHGCAVYAKLTNAIGEQNTRAIVAIVPRRNERSRRQGQEWLTAPRLEIPARDGEQLFEIDSPALQLFLGDVLHRLLGIDDEADVKGASEWLVRHLEMRLEQGALEEETFADHRDQRALDLRQRRWRVGIFAGTFPDSNV